jgi:hypothetical protein
VLGASGVVLSVMPTPQELEVAKRQAVLQRHGDDFYVQDVVECLSSDDSDFGEEDLPLEQRTSYKRAQRLEAKRIATEVEARRKRDRERGRGAAATDAPIDQPD